MAILRHYSTRCSHELESSQAYGNWISLYNYASTQVKIFGDSKNPIKVVNYFWARCESITMWVTHNVGVLNMHHRYKKNVFLIEYPERWRGLERTYHTISRRKNGPHLRKFPVVIFCEETHLISIFRAEDGFQFQQQCYFNKLKLVLDFFFRLLNFLCRKSVLTTAWWLHMMIMCQFNKIKKQVTSKSVWFLKLILLSEIVRWSKRTEQRIKVLD